MSFDADVIIVGGGLAGLSAAITAVKEGLSVIVIERGEYSGAKNVSGGRMYIHALQQLIPDALERAPLERPITKETFVFYCSDDKKLTLSFEEKGKKNSYSVLRAKFDQWLAKEAESLGVLISYSTLLTGARREGNGIVIETNRGELRAPLVIEADGVTAPLSRFLGLRRMEPKYYMLGVKEVLNIKPEGDEGEAVTIVGLTKGYKGGVFTYTNKDTISFGFTLKVDSLYNSDKPSHQLIEEIREKLGLKGEILEYSAHLIPYFGYENLPKLYDANIMVTGDAAGLLYEDGFVIRGMDMAIGSGMIAGKAAKKIKDLGDYTKTDIYYEMLKESFVLKDLENAWRSFKVLEADEKIYSSYPDFICSALSKLFSVDSNGRQRPLKVLLSSAKEKGVSVTEALKDIMEMVL
ncbi:MAG: FAD-dependent oxidoreductase [Sulfolobaceae archaeon]|nr:FAD-dependent oxidoreductase [Sulfolobaceae archaeon]